MLLVTMMYYHISLLLLVLPLYCLTIDDYNQCSIRDSCSNISSKSPLIYDDEIYIQSRNCFCDSICSEYGDCCNQTENFNSNYYECTDFLTPTLNNKTAPFSPLHIWMRTKCLINYIGSSIDLQCRNLNNQTFHDNPLLFIPVTSKETNITYRNYFCAYCNNDANNNHIEFWQYKPMCHGNGSQFDYMTLDQEEQVNYYIHNLTRNCLLKTIVYPHIRGDNQPSVFIRPCKKSLPQTCPMGTSIDLIQNCSLSPPAYRYDIISNVTYHNPYCAECNNINNHEIICSDLIRQSGIVPMGHIRVYPLSILFDPNLIKRYLQINSTIDRIYSLAYNCTEVNEIYNLYHKKCIQVTDLEKKIITSMKCLYSIQTSEDFIQFNNGSLLLNDQSIVLTKEEYIFINDNQIGFCTNEEKKQIGLPKFPIYRNILSLICTIISLICLIIFLIAFYLNPSLHNLPGKCLLFLSISLFLGQLTFISTSDLIHHSSICFISAIIIHYFYLSSFFWLLIIAIHIHSTFNRQILPPDQRTKTNYRLIIYNILVWCLTGIIVFIACLIQFINPQSKFSPNYGVLTCSILPGNAMIVFFLVPIGCLLVIVSILFFKTILAIYHSHRIAKLASVSSNNHTNDQNQIFIYARLASLMGLQWILLLFALIIQQNWIWIIFEIINSLPGVFICFGFLFSKRLWNSFKENITRKLILKRQSSKSNTTSTSLISPPVQ